MLARSWSHLSIEQQSGTWVLMKSLPAASTVKECPTQRPSSAFKCSHVPSRGGKRCMTPLSLASSAAADSLDPNGGDFSKQSCKKFRKWKKLSKRTDNISNQYLETNLRVLLELTSL